MSNNTSNASSIVSKVWTFCNTIRDDGVGYGDYLKQLIKCKHKTSTNRVVKAKYFKESV